MTIIDFETKKRERNEQKRWDAIEAMVQLGQPDLFDQLIAREEKALTTERESSCSQYINFLKGLGRDPSVIFEEATFMEPMDFATDNGVDWYEAIEAALTYYAILRKHAKDKYEFILLTHPFVASFE